MRNVTMSAHSLVDQPKMYKMNNVFMSLFWCIGRVQGGPKSQPAETKVTGCSNKQAHFLAHPVVFVSAVLSG